MRTNRKSSLQISMLFFSNSWPITSGDSDEESERELFLALFASGLDNGEKEGDDMSSPVSIDEM